GRLSWPPAPLARFCDETAPAQKLLSETRLPPLPPWAIRRSNRVAVSPPRPAVPAPSLLRPAAAVKPDLPLRQLSRPPPPAPLYRVWITSRRRSTSEAPSNLCSRNAPECAV